LEVVSYRLQCAFAADQSARVGSGVSWGLQAKRLQLSIGHWRARSPINNIIFLAIIEILGAAILNFFGISLPSSNFSGGIVIAAMGGLY